MCLAPFHLLRLAAGERVQPGARVLPHSQFRGAVPPAVHSLALEVAQWLGLARFCLYPNRVRPAAPSGLAHGRARSLGRPARSHGAVAGVRRCAMGCSLHLKPRRETVSAAKIRPYRGGNGSTRKRVRPGSTVSSAPDSSSVAICRRAMTTCAPMASGLTSSARICTTLGLSP